MTVGAHGFVGAVVPILSLVSICAVSTVYIAGYSGTAGSVAVGFTASVGSLYSGCLLITFENSLILKSWKERTGSL
jgi:hypothetical protein